MRLQRLATQCNRRVRCRMKDKGKKVEFGCGWRTILTPHNFILFNLQSADLSHLRRRKSHGTEMEGRRVHRKPRYTISRTIVDMSLPLTHFFDTVGPSPSSIRSVECNNVSDEEYLLIPILLRSDNDSRAKKVP